MWRDWQLSSAQAGCWASEASPPTPQQAQKVVWDLQPSAAKHFRLTFSVMSSEQDASRFPVGSHLIALTSFWGGENREWRVTSPQKGAEMNKSNTDTCSAILSLLQLSGRAGCFHFNIWSSCRNKPIHQILHLDEDEKWKTDCVSLECLDGSVLSQLTDMNTHVCATRGEGVVALPVHIQSWGWGEQGHHKYTLTHVHWLKGPEDKDASPYLNGRGTVVWLLPCERPIWWLSGETCSTVKIRYVNQSW